MSNLHQHSCPSSQNRLIIGPRFEIKPELVTLVIPRVGPPLLNDPSLQSTWSHWAWVASGCTTLVFFLAKTHKGAADSHMQFEPMVAGYVGYILADLLSGVYNWELKIMVTHRLQFSVYKLKDSRGTTNGPVLSPDTRFVTTCAGCNIFSQQFHAWSHSTKSMLPPLVVALQDVGILVYRMQHSAHLRPPYNNNYCIVSGICNEFLDKNKVFEALEMITFFKLGGMPKKNQSMAETDLAGIQKQIEDLAALVKQGQNETNPPKWWETQETRITALEARMTTNHNYVEDILKILTGRTGDQEHSVGVNPRGWVQKCLKYFSICGVPVEQRVELATMYLTGKAEIWFDGYIMQKHHVTWHEFEADLCHRFCDKAFTDIVEELQSCGLRDDIKHRVKALDPKTLSEAYRKAKLYELSVEFEKETILPLDTQPTDSEKPIIQEEESLEISMNAITGCIGHNTLRIQSSIQVANGQHLYSSARCNAVEWKMFCVDYRQLNNMTVKDKFLIPVVEDLLDELYGVVYFSKIYLRSGYWQIRIKDKDIYKTAFKLIKATMNLRAMSTATVLALPDFTQNFYVETDASSGGIGVVLSQNGRPIAFLSNALSRRNSTLSIYEREYLVILLVISKWRHYLEGNPFVIKTDHEPLKYLLEHKLTTTIQKRGLAKLLGLDYTIQYIKGKSNVVADALSRQWEDQGQCLAMGITLIIPSWVQEVEASYKEDLLTTDWITKLIVHSTVDTKWRYSKGILRYKVKVYIGEAGSLILQILQTLHDSPHGGHYGSQTTYQRIRSYFYWPRLKVMVVNYVKLCAVCQQTKVKHVAKPGLLQPLHIPQQAWEVITMDFVEGLPTSLRKNCILVVVDKFTKYSHFLALSHPYSAAEVAKLYWITYISFMASIKWPFQIETRPLLASFGEN
ncbi:EAP30/Vps36 family protein isoform 1 [Hibiscus syriacus]|uniref:EAP30/Vps36 family protein isoform 1 n=1 Tax=Hibiscus syriacus TaxID=106335 RepID=A0A6A3D6L7_HIBSY|nr:EAP30/Vps36 family protein isoform 1 [Hibiscus syriacus]